MKKFLTLMFTPTVILSIFVFLLPWQTRYIFGLSHLSGSFTQYGILSIYATQVILIVGLALVYASAYLSKNARSHILVQTPNIDSRHRISLLFGAIVLLVTLVSSLLAKQSIPALSGLLDLIFAGIVFAAFLDKRVNLKWVMLAFVCGLLIPVGLGMVQVLLGESGASMWLGLAGRDAQALGDAVIVLADGTRVLRAYGPFPHPNIFGGYLAVGLLSLFALRIDRRAKIAIGVILSIGLVLTASRSAVLGLVLGGLLMLLARRWSSRPSWAGQNPAPTAMAIAIVVVAVALGATLFAPAFVASLRGGGELEERSLSERTDQYHDWPNTMQSAGTWLIGNGPRSYVYTLATIHPERGVWEYQPIHSVPLLILSELGLLGLIAVIVFVITLDKQNFSRFPNRDAAYAHGMGKVLFVVIFFDHYLWSSWAGLVLMAYVGAVMLRAGEEKENKVLD